MSSRVTECPACGSKAFEPFLTAEDFHYGNEGAYAVDRCRQCGLWALAPMPSPELLASFYPRNYYSFQPISAPSPWKLRFRRWLGLARETYLPRADRPGRLLDVGCGAGHYISELARKGWSVAGVEPSTSAARAGVAAGLDIRGGSIHDADFPPASFDVIRFNHSFEHIPDPEAVLGVVRRLIRKDGYLFIGVPNTAGLWARVFTRWWWYIGLPVHTFGYDPRNLSQLLERSGFRVEQVRYNAEYAGLLGSAQIWLNRNRRPRESSGPVFTSKVLRLPALWLCRLLDLMRQGDCIEVIARPASNG